MLSVGVVSFVLLSLDTPLSELVSRSSKVGERALVSSSVLSVESVVVKALLFGLKSSMSVLR